VAPQKARSFRSALLRWYSKTGRDLPWRRTRDPYAILVSEFMLQQTQVATVMPYYEKWLERFPDFVALASASEGDVLHAWQGLGYYRRARNLHTTAKIVVDRYRGQFPKSIEQTQLFPGVGKYTAHAVATFAFNQPVGIVEANTARVLSRLFALRIPIDSTAGRNALWSHAVGLVPEKSAARYNSALLDLGALICLPGKPRCGVCPVKKFCRAKNPGSLPIKRQRAAMKRLIEKHALILKQEKLLLEKSSGRWRGMWILPSLNAHTKRNGAIYKAVFPFTNHRVTLRVFRQQPCKIDNRLQGWFSITTLDSIPIPSPHRRAIAALLN
jgi:A/G-specific adenine glycosylase